MSTRLFSLGLRALLTVATFAAVAAPARAQQPERTWAGHWTGAIQLPTGALAFEVVLAQAGGSWTGDISIPAQNASHVPLTGITATGDSLGFAIQGVPGTPTFRGVRSADGTSVAGQFTQGGQAFPFAMRTGASAADAARTALAGFDAWVDSALAAWHVVGAGIGIVVDGEVVYARGHGFRDRDRQLPVTTSTLFAIGSSSKAFTVFALGTLVDQGRIAWDNPVVDYLPWFRMYDPDVTRRLSVRDLVTHRSGLPRHDLLWYNNPTATREDLVRRLRYLRPNKDLRETFQYNNLMFLTAGYLAGTLMGTSWEDAIRSLVFQPLGMTASNFSVAESQRTADYSLPYEVRHDTVHVMPFRDISLVGPAGSINSTVDDMLKWVRMQLSDGTVDGRRVIQAATLRDMHAPHMPIGLSDQKEFGATDYGMGWFLTSYRGHYRADHGGNIDGFSALVTLYPQDHVGIVVLTNQNGSALPGLVALHAADRIFGPPLRNWNAEALARRNAGQAEERQAEQRKQSVRVPNTRPSHPLADYAGDYADSGYGTLTIAVDSGRLVATYNGIRTALEHWHYDVFNGLRNPADPTFEDMKYLFGGNLKGDIDAVSAPFEVSVDPIVFRRQPDAPLRDSTYIQRFAGRYALATDTVTVVRQGAVLVLSVRGQPGYRLLPYRRAEFDLEGLQGFSLLFTTDASGAVTGAVARQPNGVFTAKRLP
ncbi:MAG TPA: serine hydrolase [Gemmatimonadales bacterium]|nr:serine hydrolase [Gemmatimonadales bacterium]